METRAGTKRAVGRKKRTIKMPPISGGKASPEVVERAVRAGHITEVEGGWRFRKAGRRRIVKIFDSREKAIEFAKKEAASSKTSSEIFLHNPEGGVTLIAG